MEKKKHVRELKSLKSPKNKKQVNVKLRDYFQDKSCDCIICKTENKFNCLKTYSVKSESNNKGYDLINKELTFNFIINLLKEGRPLLIFLILLICQFDYSILITGTLLNFKKFLKTIPLPF